MADSALVQITKNNDIIIARDTDHRKDDQFKALADQVDEMHEQGLRHLFLENDPSNVSVTDYQLGSNGYRGLLINKAIGLGMQVHLYDDRSWKNERAERYPEESKFAAANPYRTSPTITKYAYAEPEPQPMSALSTQEMANTLLKPDFIDDKTIKKIEAAATAAFKPEADFLNVQMNQYAEKAKRLNAIQAFFSEEQADMDSNIEFRNVKMTKNIDAIMRQYPNEKALVLVGAAHVAEEKDLDEHLRAVGYRVSDVETYMGQPSPTKHIHSPDFQINEDGEVTAYTSPTSWTLKTPAPNEELHWKNNETIGHEANSEETLRLKNLNLQHSSRLDELTAKNHQQHLTQDEQREFRVLSKFMPTIDEIQKSAWQEGAKQFIIRSMYDNLAAQDFSQSVSNAKTSNTPEAAHEKSLGR